jgi:hypothetical protein
MLRLLAVSGFGAAMFILPARVGFDCGYIHHPDSCNRTPGCMWADVKAVPFTIHTMECYPRDLPALPMHVATADECRAIYDPKECNQALGCIFQYAHVYISRRTMESATPAEQSRLMETISRTEREHGGCFPKHLRPSSWKPSRPPAASDAKPE